MSEFKRLAGATEKALARYGDWNDAYKLYQHKQTEMANRLASISLEKSMTEQEALQQVVMEAIRGARISGEDLSKAAEGAAKAFKAGMAAYEDASPMKPSAPLRKVSKAASKGKSRRP